MIYELINNTPDKHMDKTTLAALTGLSDREIRKQVEIERAQGFVIFSSSYFKGYSTSATIEEWTRLKAETLNRINKLNGLVNLADNQIQAIRSNCSQQLSLF